VLTVCLGQDVLCCLAVEAHVISCPHACEAACSGCDVRCPVPEAGVGPAQALHITLCCHTAFSCSGCEAHTVQHHTVMLVVLCCHRS
jgi:hypothetical protein